MAKKKRIVNEKPSINFRLSKELKNKISDLAQKENKTLSNYLIDHLESFVDGTLFENELNWDQDRKFMFSEEFTQLIVWMYSKRVNEICSENGVELSRYINVLKKIDNKFPDIIERDFDKVLQDVLRVKNNRSTIRTFNFIKQGNEGLGFNFRRWENYILKGELPKTIIYIKP